MTHEAVAIEPSGTGLWEAVVMECAGGAVTVRASGLAAVGSEARVAVRNAHAGYAPACGDRVLVQSDAPNSAHYLIGVLQAVVPSVRTANGVTASIEDERVMLRQADGTLLVEFDSRTGRARVSAQGDLALAAPSGRITLEAATDVCIEAGRRIVHRVRDADGAKSEFSVDPRGATLTAPSMDVNVETARARVGEATVHAKRMETVAERVVQTVADWELRADKVSQHARTMYTDVEGLLQTRAERARTIVRETLQMIAGRTRIRSKEDTSIDGRRVLLG
jgi:hypothetical protein